MTSSAGTMAGPDPASLSTGRRRVGRVALVLAGVLLFVATIAGYANRQLLDSDNFAASVHEIVLRPSVNEALARELTAGVLRARPDLVAVAPLVESVSQTLLASRLVTGPVRLAASQLHAAFTTPESGQLVLRLADLGAVVISVLGELRAPAASTGEPPTDEPPAATAATAAATPTSESVALRVAGIGSQGFAADTIRLARFVDVVALVAPLGALGAFALAVWASADRRRALGHVAVTFVVVAAAIALLLVVVGALARSAEESTLTGAFVEAAWYVLVRPLWWAVGALLLVAVLAALGLRMAASPGGVRAGMAEVARAVTRPADRRAAALRAVVVIALGVVLLVDPRGLLTVATVVVGAALVVVGLEDLVEQVAGWRAARAGRTAGGDAESAVGGGSGSASRRVRPRLLLGTAGVVVLGLVVWSAWPAGSVDAGDAAQQGAVAGAGEVCNGHAELCGRRFDEVAYGATHNSMSIAGAPGWFLAEQGRDIPGQLALGARALLVDVWYGYPAGSVTRTSARSYAEALAVAEAEVGPEIVAAAQRVIAAAATAQPTGPEGLFLCHGLCETGSTPLAEMLGEVRAWLATHPDEVLTLFVENHVEPADLASAVEGAGLGGYVSTPPADGPWPTLREMIRSGRRLVVMTEDGDGGAAAPWLVNGFSVTQDTPYTFPTVESFSCAPNRGPAGAPLFLLNHWLAGFTALVTSAQQVNTLDVLGSRAEQCRRERGQIPNFVAVNFLDIGDTMAVVDRLNGV